MRFKQKISGIVLAAALLASVWPVPALAATGVIYITPASSSLQNGNSETLALRINPGTTVDGVQATVSYNPGLLQLNSVDTSASPFSVVLQKSASGGTITLSLGNLSGGVSSDALMASMNFTALAGSGSAALSISNANATSGGAYTNPAAAGASISLTSPASVPTPSPVGGTSGGGSTSGSKSSGGSSTTSTKAATAASNTDTSAAPTTTSAPSGNSATPTQPVHLKSQLGKVSYKAATIKVSSNLPQNLYILYGTDAMNLGSKTSVVTGKNQATLTLGQDQPLTPGTVYYYQVVGEDNAGNQTKLPVRQLLTAGYTVRVTVLDAQNQPLKNTEVSLHSRLQSAKTDDNGVAAFTNVAPGLHHVQYVAGGKTYSQAVYVEDAPTMHLAAVVLPVQFSAQDTNSVGFWAIVGIGAATIAAYSLGFETAHSHWLQLRSQRFIRHISKLAAAGRSWLF